MSEAVEDPAVERLARERRRARRSPWITSVLGALWACGFATGLSMLLGGFSGGPLASRLFAMLFALQRGRWPVVLGLYAVWLAITTWLARRLSVPRLATIARAVKLLWIGVALALAYPLHSLCNCLEYLGASDALIAAPFVLALAVIAVQLWRGRREARRSAA